MNKELNRRDFLRVTGIFAGSAFLASCAPELAKVASVATVPNIKPLETKVSNPIQTPENNINEEPSVKKELSGKKFAYFSQKDPQWKDIPNSGSATTENQGCGPVTGGMVTDTTPLIYWDIYAGYFKGKGEERILTVKGTSAPDHQEVLKSIHYDVPGIEGKVKYIKSEIRRYTSVGIPVWVNAGFGGKNNWIDHHSMAIGIDENENIIFNDPLFGEAVHFSDEQINTVLKNGTSWRVFAVISPANKYLVNS